MAETPRIPGIELQDELGRGAHSVVYRARQDGVACAVKLPRVRARWTRWIYREAVALARVKHPGLPTVLEVGEADGLPYLVMELIAGETLAERLERDHLDETEVVVMARQLAGVLEAVHEAGLVHRDVKPRNIVVESGTGVLKLVDFGFATPMERADAADAAGTAAYAAPEQLSPPGQVDGRADLFALGRTLFECLAPATPSRRNVPWNRDHRAELLASGVSPVVAEIIAALVQHRPEDRYPTASALLADLERLEHGLPLLGPTGHRQRVAARPLVVRRTELDRIGDLVRADETRGSIALVAAPRGGGKTHLLRSVEQEIAKTTVTVSVTCREGDLALAAVGRAFEAYCDALSAHWSETTIAELIGNLAPVARILAPLRFQARGSLVDRSLGASVEALAEGTAEMFVRLAATAGPMAMIIDDAQWVDASSALALASLAHRLDEAPVSVIVGSRVRDGLVASLARVQPGRMLALELLPLSRAEAREVIEGFLGSTQLDVALVDRIVSMADGTPLGVMEVLGSFLDAGALRPHARGWSYDVSRLDHVVLSKGAVALFGRRVAELPAATRKVLDVAVVIGPSFEDELLGQCIGVPLEDLGFALASMRRAGLVELDTTSTCTVRGHRFVHDSLRETLLAALSDDERQQNHQLVAEMLASLKRPSVEQLYAAATHFESGVPGRASDVAYRAARAAAAAALSRFDNDAVLHFLAQAAALSSATGTTLDAGFYRAAGEAHLRLGAVDESLDELQKALERSTVPAERVELLGRLSWVRQVRAEPDEAWALLDRAFRTLGKRMPIENLSSAATTSASVIRSKLARLLHREQTSLEAGTVDVLCQLHYQNARLGLEYGKPGRLLQSSLEFLELSERGGSDDARARAHAFYALALAALGRKTAALREGEAAARLASAAAEPGTIAFVIQLQAASATWAGDLDPALALFRECVDVHGPWLEVNEFCLVVSSAEAIQSIRGRANDAWPWIERGVNRLRRSRIRPVVAEFIVHRARAARAACGLGMEDDAWLAAENERVSPNNPGRGYHRIASWGPCIRFYYETDDFGPAFEELVEAFRAEAYNPKNVHLGVVEYYITLAHIRLHQVLRAPAEGGREAKLRALRDVASDLRATAKIPLMTAHARAIDGALAWLEGKDSDARRLLGEAERLADEQNVPWVLYAVARTRAHMLRAAGREEAARDQARAAELFARQHGAVTRVRWIQEEFALAKPHLEVPVIVDVAPSIRRSSSRSNRQLTTLLHIVRAPRRDLKAEQQAGAILDELVSSLGAERGAIWFQPEPNVAGTTVARHRSNEASIAISADSGRGRLLRSVHRTGAGWPPLHPADENLAEGEPFDPSRVIAIPLYLYEKPVGALSIERSKTDPDFDSGDRNLLYLLSHQVPIALEIARLLFEREQLHASLQHAKKMEAMGALAGGLAHDFNNMLAAMRVALGAAQERAAQDSELSVELEIISQATTRAAQLTGQLLSFSRHQPVPVAVHEVNQLISTLEPMLRRVVGSKVDIVVNLSSAVDAVEVDQGSFDQALVNLLINARDAMPGGGKITVTTRNIVLADSAAQRANVPPGAYVEIQIADTGEGMSAETMSRIFEPFFTTKAVGSGSGLGLAMVYAFARNCGGSIDVESELGRGTQFKLYLRRVERARTVRTVRPLATNAPGSVLKNVERDTILVVDDDDLVRRSISKILERNGYRVVAANSSNEALRVVSEQGGRIGLVILDVLMPGTTGPELGRRLYDLNLPAKLLFVSGFSPESIPIEEHQVAAEMLLQKPFSQNTLLERVRQLMNKDAN